MLPGYRDGSGQLSLAHGLIGGGNIDGKTLQDYVVVWFAGVGIGIVLIRHHRRLHLGVRFQLENRLLGSGSCKGHTRLQQDGRAPRRCMQCEKARWNPDGAAPRLRRRVNGLLNAPGFAAGLVAFRLEALPVQTVLRHEYG